MRSLCTAARSSPCLPQLEKARMQPGDLAKKERKTENFPNLGEIWTCKFKKLISNPKISIQNNLLQDTQSKPSKSKDKERIPSLKRRKNSVTQEDSHKEISGFVQGNLADHEERLITYSTLT